MKNLSLATAGVGETDKTVMTSEQLAIKACPFFVFVFCFCFVFWGETEKTVMTSEQIAFNKGVSVFSCFCFVLFCILGVKHLTQWLSLTRLDQLKLQFSSSHVKIDV